MLSYKARKVCDAYYNSGCSRCPLRKSCLMPTVKQPGTTIREKALAWVDRMNKAAEKVRGV